MTASRSTPSRSAPSRSAPSRSAPSRSAPSRSTTFLATLLAVLACVEVVLVAGDAADGVRYGVGAALAVTIVAVVARLAGSGASD
ncbi:hypothetical protein GCM10010234_48330 [Streptomyces hawaiiensis]|uniref:hypothetical protein n=1 Tax=Streptomyces hawaiiensis TaxID=67305 RepID=UPI0031D35D16